MLQINLLLLSAPRGIGQRSGDVFGFKVRVKLQDGSLGLSSSNKAGDGTDRNPQVADARLASHHGGIASNTISGNHEQDGAATVPVSQAAVIQEYGRTVNACSYGPLGLLPSGGPDGWPAFPMNAFQFSFWTSPSHSWRCLSVSVNSSGEFSGTPRVTIGRVSAGMGR